MSRLRWHFRCIAAVVSSYVLGTQTALSVVGFVCRRMLGMPIANVFLLYPARKEYADALAYRWHQRRFGWQPGLVGFYRQAGRYGLIFGIPNLEDEIRAPENAARVLAVMSRMEAIQRRVGAPRKVFAGILPSTLARNGAEDEHLSQQRHLTARAVLQALDHVLELNGLTRDVRILVLGGRGYIASEVIRLGGGLRITSIDADGWDEFRQFAEECRGSAVVVLNLTKSGALLDYARELWPGVIVLNDAYNANPTSMDAALRALAQTATAGRRIAVLGDMRELGPYAGDAHAAVGRHAAELGIDVVIGVGPGGRQIVDAARGPQVHTAALWIIKEIISRCIQPVKSKSLLHLDPGMIWIENPVG